MADLEALGQIGSIAGGGIDRPAFSRDYRRAVDWLADRMDDAGLRVRQDEAGNLIGRIGPGGSAVICGSHIDSVPSGGTLDGALGVLAGVECARAFRDARINLSRALEVVAFVDEEGAYVSLFGSRAMTGTITGEEVRASVGRQGKRLVDALREYGIEPGGVHGAARSSADIAGYIELHIEQGPVLEAVNRPIGIVESIVGILTTEVQFAGLANHAGTTPMIMRHDALRAAAETVTEAYRMFDAEGPPDMRLTYGALNLSPNASNVIPGLVRITQEVRGTKRGAMETCSRRCLDIAKKVAQSRRVSVTSETLSCNEPAVMSPAVRARIAEACDRSGYAYHAMPSGAGHDAQVFATLCETGMIFIPSEAGISHNAVERTAPELIANGLTVLYLVLHDWLTERVVLTHG